MEMYNVIDGDSLNVVLQKEDIYFNDSWVFWYDDSPPKGIKKDDYEHAIKELGAFSTVQEFWRLWTNLNDVKSLPDYSNIRLFRKGVKPMWEDPANTNGGKWVVPAHTVAEAERLWSIVIIAAIGEQFDEGIDLTGIVLSLRPKENILQLWTKTAVTDPIRQAVQRAALQHKLDLNPDMEIIFQVHFASLEFTKNFVKRPRSSNKKKRGGRKLNYGDNSDESDSRTTPTNGMDEESGEEDLPFFVPIADNGSEIKPISPVSPRKDLASPQLSMPRSSSSLSHRNPDITNSPRGNPSTSPTNFSPRNSYSPRNPPSTTPPPRPVGLTVNTRPDSRGFNTGSPVPARYSPQPLSPNRHQTREYRSQSCNEPFVPEIPFAPIRSLTPNPPPPVRSNTPSGNQEKYHPPNPRSPPRHQSQQPTPTSPTRPPSRFGAKSPLIPFGVNNGSNNNGSRPPSRASPFPGSPAGYGRPPSRSSSTSPSFHNRQLHQTQVAELLKRVSKSIEQPTAYIDLKEDNNAIALVSELVSISLRKKRTNNLGLSSPTPTRSSPAASSPSSPLDSPNMPSSPRLMPQFISSGSSAFSIKKSQESPPPNILDGMDPVLKRELLSFDLNGLPQPTLLFTSEAPVVAGSTSPSSNSASPQTTTTADGLNALIRNIVII